MFSVVGLTPFQIKYFAVRACQSLNIKGEKKKQKKMTITTRSLVNIYRKKETAKCQRWRTYVLNSCCHEVRTHLTLLKRQGEVRDLSSSFKTLSVCTSVHHPTVCLSDVSQERSRHNNTIRI